MCEGIGYIKYSFTTLKTIQIILNVLEHNTTASCILASEPCTDLNVVGQKEIIHFGAFLVDNMVSKTDITHKRWARRG
jgi:hypothetical protein